MKEVNPESMEVSRRRLLVQGLVAFGLWQVADVIRRAVPGLTREWRIGLVIAALLGWVIWSIHLLKMSNFQKLLKRDPALREALNDERIRQLRLRAFFAGYWALLCAIGVFYGLSLFLPLPGSVVAQILLIVGVCSPMLALLIYDRN